MNLIRMDLPLHHQNIQKLVYEMFKVLAVEKPETEKEISRIRDEASYELWQRSFFDISLVNTVLNVTECIKFLGPKIWELVPNDIKYFENLRESKRVIKKLKPTPCSLRICKT